ncbi:hypothetical protein SDC9_181500 [bioreactor metagenome]|uniref:Uncharacterized protein n=1 Tax=bioreactor metagenome TaxID=1076179 RepID=A0A645H4T9_9ZZZZ
MRVLVGGVGIGDLGGGLRCDLGIRRIGVLRQSLQLFLQGIRVLGDQPTDRAVVRLIFRHTGSLGRCGHVSVDVVVGEDLGLRTGGHLLTCVLAKGCGVVLTDPARSQLGVDALVGRHRDRLIGELVADISVREVAADKRNHADE